ncbi:class I adenylate-forming enzyme family protein [Halegenticoccus tardaugens]|uniref:class I adenylate-forming enzyme family protein n=1 Tax=Halegenticoccus tardaugens TaxID=2071624 RepID=UPI00100A7F2D|nr:AMP-binding protein [Halegenticoccus tardaugens]
MNFGNIVDLAAADIPARPAAGDAGGLLTYAALSRRTNAAANAFARLGVDAGDRVAICLDNGLAFLTAHLGAMKRGAVSVSINTQFTDAQVRYVLDVSDVSALVTDKAFASVADVVDATLTVDGSARTDYRTALEAADDEATVHPRRSDELAEILYTSGTTGRPKGVRHTHGNVVANAMGIVTSLGLTRKDVGLTVCQCFHVTGLNVTTTPLLFARGENRMLPTFTPERVFSAVETYGITYAFFTPSMVIDLIEDGGAARYDLSSLTTVGVGGAPMPKGRFEEAEATFGCPILEGYGMTETTPLAAFNRPDTERKSGSVGPPAREVVDLRIEDPETGDAVARGERGELLWRGDTVTPGYERRRNDAAAFVERDGERWFRSGDVGRLDEDGYLFVVDRLEDMFTTGCANVSPRKIEEALYELDAIGEAAVIDTRDDLKGAVVTVVIVRAGDDLTAEQVQTVCDERLEDYEVPQRVEFVEELPTTATGKVDRVALRKAYGDPRTRRQGEAGPTQ